MLPVDFNWQIVQFNFMKVVAFLQNQWFKNPEKVRVIYASHKGDLDRRAKLNAAYLFWSSMTGKRIYEAFGETEFIRHEVVWEEISTEIGGQSSCSFEPDFEHINKVIAHHKPDIVLAFGKLATGAVQTVQVTSVILGKSPKWKLITGPHPAARHASVKSELREMCEKLRAEIAWE